MYIMAKQSRRRGIRKSRRRVGGALVAKPKMSPINEADVKTIKELTNDAKFEGLNLVPKVEIQKGADGNYYATKVVFSEKPPVSNPGK